MCGALTFTYISFMHDWRKLGICWFVLFVGCVITILSCAKDYFPRVLKPILYPVDRIPEFSKTLSAFALFASSYPLLVSYIFVPEYRNPELCSFIIKSVVNVVFMLSGIAFFAQGHIPERFAPFFNIDPHIFDYVGHSHQWWHVVSATLMIYWVVNTAAHISTRIAMMQ